jgi:choline dehydrogenase-like flavoprotein
VLDYDVARIPLSLSEHRNLVRRFKSSLAKIGLIAFSQRIGLAGTAHASGTLMTGTDAQNSVVNAHGQVHGMRSLYVVDGSVLPRSSRVNPSLSIFAWALRVAAGFVSSAEKREGAEKSAASV